MSLKLVFQLKTRLAEENVEVGIWLQVRRIWIRSLGVAVA